MNAATVSSDTIELMPEHTHKDVKIIALVGLSGAGKSTVTDYLGTKDYPKVHFGNVILSALKEAGLEPTLENEKMMREKLRGEEGEEGEDVVVRRIIEQIHHLVDSGQHRIIADGMGAWDAYKLLRHEFPGELTVVALATPRRLRHHRLTTRIERPLTDAEANQRDYDEIERLNKGGVIAMADYFVPNEDDTDALYARVDQLLKQIEF